ncbi:hypothetical protein V6U77_27215, partial [Micromonospora sp. CPCC 205546]|uniref:hypothetical protein n=1 Tax=Micromonospora sp. CPCC 205546 TaxID=3122397 RepID=UPI002FF1C2C3
EAAVAAFRAARAARAAGAPAGAVAPARRRRFTAGALAWGAGIVVTATAGAAFAAVTLDRADDPTPPRPATPAPFTPTPATTQPQREPTAAPGGGDPTGTPSAVVTSGTSTPGATAAASTPTPSPDAGHLRGLCRAYLAKKPEQREKALDTPSFARLVAAAGGRDRVGDFCGEMVPEAAAEKSPDKPTRKQPTSTATPGPAVAD